MKAKIKDWFDGKLAKELGLPRLYSLDIFCGIKETEKAVYAMFYTGYSNSGHAYSKCHWIPKSAIENLEELRMIDDYTKAKDLFSIEYDM
jgi:hypothetical protein